MLTHARYAMICCLNLIWASANLGSPELSGSKLKVDKGSELVDPKPFRMLVGSLQYLTPTRPDLTYQVNQVSQFMQRP